MKTGTVERVIYALKKVTGTFNEALNYEGDLKDEMGLDSIQTVEFFAELEQEFEIELPLKMMTARTAKDFLDMLECELNAVEVL